MPSNPEMAKFLYTIVKQLDLKSIDWNQVSSELGITNGHAARMRYSRFKQQMEGNAPVRRAPRNPNMRRTPKQKRAKDEDKKVKSEEPSSLNSSMMTSSPSASLPDASQESHVPVTPEPVMVKSEPRENIMIAELSPTMPSSTYGLESPVMAMQTMNMAETASQNHSQPSPLQIQVQPEPISGQHPHAPEYSYNLPHHQAQIHHQHQQQHQQQQQRMYQSLPPQTPHPHLMMSADLAHEMAMAAAAAAEPRDFEPFMGIDLYSLNDMSCHGHMMGPIKVEERWDPSYGQA